MQTERFNQLRKSILSKVFKEKTIITVWRKIVKNQLRSLDFSDLYDHYDFNYNIEERAKVIRSELLNGTYKAAQPLIYRIEKKYGVCRHLVIPQPIDALVLQVLVEHIAESVLSKQPSENSYYSRDKHNSSFPHEVDEYGLSWRKQWKQLQKTIYNFYDEKELIAVTDLSNYYDSIDMSELKKVFMSYAEMDEVITDLLFRIIEEISWKPDYLPYSSRGLPTTNIEGIRLLAHSFLFEIDEVLKEKTNNSFTRWMDDIVIGINTKKEGIETISSVSDMLKTRGLALNLSKTNIYTDKEGYHHFQIKENRYIDSIENIKKGDPNYKKTCSDLHKKFKNHFKDTSPKYWDKIAKRYISTYGKLESKTLLNILAEKYISYPGLRYYLLIYLSRLGYSQRSSEVVLQILKNIEIFDDLSLYQVCNLITKWEIPITPDSNVFLKDFEKFITEIYFGTKTSSSFYCLIWFKAKYNHPESLLKFLATHKQVWETDSFLRRQVTSVLARLGAGSSNEVDKILYNQISSGVSNTVNLATQISHFTKKAVLNPKLGFYLFPVKPQNPYPLGKFIVLCSVLNSPNIRTNKVIQTKVLEHIKDPYYLKWIDQQYNIR